MDNPQLLSAILLVLILSGGAYYLGKDQSASNDQRATIEANNNTIINIGAGMMDITAEEFKLLIDGAVKDKAKLAKEAVRVVKPAKRDLEASIIFNDNTQLQITPETVRACPNMPLNQTMKRLSKITQILIWSYGPLIWIVQTRLGRRDTKFQQQAH